MITYNLNHVNGLFFELLTDEGKNREYDVSFIDNSNFEKNTIYESKMKVNTWVRLDRKYLSDISIVVSFQGRTITQINLLIEIINKKVFINFESSSLGDTIAWMPYCLAVKKMYLCDVVVSTFHNYLFEKEYPELTFVGRGVVVNDIFAMFELGWFWDKAKEPVNPITIPLQQTACNILNLPYHEIKPKIDFTPTQRPIEDKYVAIGIHSTSRLKLWDYWQDVVDYLIDKGYKVIEISKIDKDHKSFYTQPQLTNIIQLENTSMVNTMNVIHHCEYYIGLSSGLSWLSWALNKQVVMIANFTNKSHEFQSNCIRVTSDSVCNSCWNNPMFKFDKSNWEFCPEHEDTPRQFECHKSIGSNYVIEKLNNIL